MNALIQTIAVFALPVIFAITLHEAAHGYVAKYFGDATAYLQGRVTLNPLKHIDPVGTVLLPLGLAVLSSVIGYGIVFGYAKPVPVQFANLRNPKRDMVWVALAGPAANFVQAALWILFGYAMEALGVSEPFVYEMVRAGILVNGIIFAFNLLPIPPLDGGRVLIGLLPTRASIAYSRVEPYGFVIVLGLMFVLPGLVNSVWLGPVTGAMQTVLGILFSPLA